MISPRFATMFCFVQTDAALAPETADLLFGVCVKRSFDRASVDGQLSTNDTAILMCSGSSGVSIAPESEDELRFGEALDALLRQLAIMMVADGEGARADRARGRARRRPRRRRGGRARRRQLAAGQDRAARRRSQLGADRPGGRRRPGREARLATPLAVDISIEGIQVCSAGAAIPYDEEALASAAAGEGGRVRDRPAGRGRRDRGVLLRPRRTSTSRSTPTTHT